jgi:hypothetical protein
MIENKSGIFVVSIEIGFSFSSAKNLTKEYDIRLFIGNVGHELESHFV